MEGFFLIALLICLYLLKILFLVLSLLVSIFCFEDLKGIDMDIFTFCHRRPERTLKIRGRYLPVCARCTGIYAGMLVFFSLQFFSEFNYGLNLFFVSILLLPMALDGTTQLLKLRESTNVIRLITGFICGIGYLMLLLVSIEIIQEVL